MHPPLLPEKHPICKDAIIALLECHKENKWAKFWGACNDPDFALTRCLAEEKKILRADRQAKAKEAYKAQVAAQRQREEEAALRAQQRQEQQQQQQS